MTRVRMSVSMARNEEERVALEHVAASIEKYGHHSPTSCPPPMRAMCPYHDILKVIEERHHES